MNKREKIRANTEAAMAVMREAFPLAFPADPEQVRPLAISTRDDIAAWATTCPDVSERYAISAIQRHCNRTAYKTAVIAGGMRIDLHGRETSPVSPEAQELAKTFLAQAAEVSIQRAKNAEIKARKREENIRKAAEAAAVAKAAKAAKLAKAKEKAKKAAQAQAQAQVPAPSVRTKAKSPAQVPSLLQPTAPAVSAAKPAPAVRSVPTAKPAPASASASAPTVVVKKRRSIAQAGSSTVSNKSACSTMSTRTA